MSVDEGSAPAPIFDAGRIVKALSRHHVDFLIVGGIGAQAHGATRPTADFDCLARFDRDNLERLCDAMRELNARIRADGFSDEEAIAVASTMLHPDTFRHAELTTWQTDSGPLDVLHDIPATTERAKASSNSPFVARRATSQGSECVSRLDDIVGSKEWANRPKDHAALDEMHALQDQKQLRPDRSLDDRKHRSRRPPGHGIDR